MINSDKLFKHLKTECEMILYEFRKAVDYFIMYLHLNQ